MKIFRSFLMVVLVSLCIPLGVLAQDEQAGAVNLPLEKYNSLVEASRKPEKEPKEAPAAYALGQSSTLADVKEVEESASASIVTELDVEIFENEWVAVPILPAGTAVVSAKVDGKTVPLISTPKGLAWGVNKRGTYRVSLIYNVDAQRFETGYALAIPLPEAAAINFTAKVPGTGLDVAAIPASGSKVETNSGFTTLTASIPTSRGVQLTWRVPRQESHVISRASYKGVQTKDAVTWTGVFDVEMFNDETLTLKVLPKEVTLREVLVDGKSSNVLVEDNHYATLVKGRGTHKIQVSFQVSVSKSDGPPQIAFAVPEVPISLFELSLEGKKELDVTPMSNVETMVVDGQTESKVYVPMTSRVRFTWSEAVPEEVKAEARSNALLYHAVHAEEGVLYVDAIADYQITRGELNILELELPEDIAVNQVSSPLGIIADWRVSKLDDGARVLSVFLDRQVEDQIRLNVKYDRSIVGKKAKENLEIPLLKALNVNRQRGMAALLATKELTLKPLKEEKITKVGENQLPAHVKQGLSMTIAHTYKYVEEAPLLVVQATEPEKKHGKFDALVHTLISLGDVTVKGAATCEINVKSGKIMDLQLRLPNNTNFLNLTGPSIRTHKVVSKDSHQEVEVQFTQEMEGQFRLEAAYERIIQEGETSFDVPTLQVVGAEAKTGFVAVEALSAVEVQPAEVTHLTSMQSNELPQQLVLKTTNPILLAYKYVTIPYTLKLKVTRHRVIDVQAAAIDVANYTTLYVKDGLAVTNAEFRVRNSRKQFLRVRLPENSEVWSVLVNGKPEKPAIAEVDDKQKQAKGTDVLIKVINSTQGFPVSLVYQTTVPKIEYFGRIHGVLPRPDMAVTNTSWRVYLPEDMDYLSLDTNMEISEEGVYRGPRVVQHELRSVGKRQGAPMPQIDLPTGGIHYSFEKLYANKSTEDAFFSLYYVSQTGQGAMTLIVVFATLLLWSGIIGLFVEVPWMTSSRGKIAIGVGLLALYFLIGYLEFKSGMRWLTWTSGLVFVGLIAMVALRRKSREAADESAGELGGEDAE